MSGDRERIDWAGLKPLPRKRRDGSTPEDLAARKFNIAKAKHKGRNHIANWKRRQAKRDAEKLGRIKQAKNEGNAARFIEAVRAYWKGETDEHP